MQINWDRTLPSCHPMEVSEVAMERGIKLHNARTLASHCQILHKPAKIHFKKSSPAHQSSNVHIVVAIWAEVCHFNTLVPTHQQGRREGEA